MAKANDSIAVSEAEQRLQNVIAQEAERQKALRSLASLRDEAVAEVDRLIAFLDASDEYVTTELECTDDPSDEECREVGTMSAYAHCSEDFEPSLGWTDREAGKGRYMLPGIIDAEMDNADEEPSLAAFERHPSAYGCGRDGTGNQENWAAGTRDDREDEHDGSEPDDESDGKPDDEPLLGWTLNGQLGSADDREACDHGRASDLPAARERFDKGDQEKRDGIVWANGRLLSAAAAEALRAAREMEKFVRRPW